MGFAHVAQPSYRAFSFNFGEVFNGASDTLLRTCRSPFGILRPLGLERRSRGDRPTSIRGSGLGRQRRVEDNAPYQLRPGGGYLMPLSAALVASRKAVPTNVKDQPPRPFTGKMQPLYRTTAGDASGNLRLKGFHAQAGGRWIVRPLGSVTTSGNWHFAGRSRGMCAFVPRNLLKEAIVQIESINVSYCLFHRLNCKGLSPFGLRPCPASPEAHGRLTTHQGVRQQFSILRFRVQGGNGKKLKIFSSVSTQFQTPSVKAVQGLSPPGRRRTPEGGDRAARALQAAACRRPECA